MKYLKTFALTVTAAMMLSFVFTGTSAAQHGRGYGRWNNSGRNLGWNNGQPRRWNGGNRSVAYTYRSYQPQYRVYRYRTYTNYYPSYGYYNSGYNSSWYWRRREIERRRWLWRHRHHRSGISVYFR